MGVELHPNGSTYSGEFCVGVASGYGVYVGACADEYIGQWENGARHGVGVHVDADAVMSIMRFNTDEPVAQDVEENADASGLSWEDDVQVHVLRAVLAEKEGARNQESARQRHIEAVLQEMTTLGSETFNAPEEVLSSETKEQLELTDFISDQSNQIRRVNAEAGELKFAEAQLIQRQKELRAEITSRRKELDCSGDHKDLRVALLLRKIAHFDVVILQEMFEVGPRQKRFVRAAYAMGFRYHCGSVWPRLLDPHLIDGGLLILSRFPIVERDQLAFSQGSGSDGICAKGVLYARIQLSPDLSDSLHVFTTHTQAGDHQKEYGIRHAQLQEMHRFVARTIREDPGVPVLITGDFNLDARHNLVHDTRSGAPISSRCRESDVYQQLVGDFERVIRQARLDTAREGGEKDSKKGVPVVIDLMKRCDGSKLGEELHPITNGDGHATLVHTTDPLSPEKDGKCIDYMFFFPGEGDQSALTTSSSTTSSDSTKGDDGDAVASFDSPLSPRFRLTLVDEGTKVDQCKVDELTEESDSEEFEDDDEDSDHQQRRHPRHPRPSRLPITNLSDHYALRAEFVLETSRVTRPDGRPVDQNESLASLLQLYFPQHAFKQQPRSLWKWKLAIALIAIVAAAGGVALTLARAVLAAVI
ncbi:hypothetical protein BBJ28_00001713 [Nothophytophthora sp. Chile5]|nr:hypothetical protein BBJ28_00001713 [Nothophytophthora sp. Chile5]